MTTILTAHGCGGIIAPAASGLGAQSTRVPFRLLQRLTFTLVLDRIADAGVLIGVAMVAVKSYNATWLTSGSAEGASQSGRSGLLGPVGGRWHLRPPDQLLLEPLALLFVEGGHH